MKRARRKALWRGWLYAVHRHSEDSVHVVRVRDESAFAPPLVWPDGCCPIAAVNLPVWTKGCQRRHAQSLEAAPGDQNHRANVRIVALPPPCVVLRYAHPVTIVGRADDVSAAGSDRPVQQSLRRSTGPLPITLNVQACRKPRGICMAALHKICFPNGQKTSIVLAADAFGGFLPVPPQQLFPSGGL